jgi:hypothetical protein
MPYASTMYAEIGFACAEWVSQLYAKMQRGKCQGAWYLSMEPLSFDR